MAKKVSLKATTAIDLGLSVVEREVVNSVRDALLSEKENIAREIAAMQAAAKDGTASKTFSDLYRAAAVAEILGFEKGDAGIVKAQALMAEGVKREEKQQLAILAAGNRLARRLIAAGLASATPKKARKPKAPKAPKEPKNSAVRETPTLANATDWAAFYTGIESLLQNAQRKNADALAKCPKAASCMEDLLETLSYHAKKANK